jgi:hypothetical protein
MLRSPVGRTLFTRAGMALEWLDLAREIGQGIVCFGSFGIFTTHNLKGTPSAFCRFRTTILVIGLLLPPLRTACYYVLLSHLGVSQSEENFIILIHELRQARTSQDQSMFQAVVGTVWPIRVSGPRE